MFALIGIDLSIVQAKIIIIQGLIFWQVLIRISQRNKHIITIQGRLMHATSRPLARTLEPAADTLPARQLKGSNYVDPSALMKDHITTGRFVGLQRVETRHL